MNNSLAEVHPELISEWSEKNLPLTPNDITFGSNKKVWWRGACGHEWQASVKARSGGEKCPSLLCPFANSLSAVQISEQSRSPLLTVALQAFTAPISRMITPVRFRPCRISEMNFSNRMSRKQRKSLLLLSCLPTVR